MSRIQKIHARQILDSRDTPTISAEVYLEDGSVGTAAVPSGASTGEHEAYELRDGDPADYNGKSVHKAIANIHEKISPILVGQEASGQEKIDKLLIELDGTKNKKNLGANAVLAVSLACAVAEAKSEKVELFEYLQKFSLYKNQTPAIPHAMFNVLNGGRHAKHSSDFQEYMIIPMLEDSFAENLKCASEIFQSLKQILEKYNFPTTVGDEGGFAPPVTSNTQGLDILVEAITKAGYKPGSNVFIGLDIAASEFFENNTYNLKTEGLTFSSDQFIKYIQKTVSQYPIISIEDPLEQNDFPAWAKLTQELGRTVQIVGDDLYTTNTERLEYGIAHKSSTAILIKPNQIGTLTETIGAINTAHKNNFKTIVSHRSGETEDTFIADLAVGLHSPQIKAGSLSRSERIAKYNRLLKIEELLH